jgi:hypothetical protein
VSTPDYPVGEWIINPDLSAVAGFEPIYWTITGDTVSLQTPAERAATDAAVLAADTSAAQADTKAPLAESLDPIGMRDRAMIELHNKRINYAINRILEVQAVLDAMLNSSGSVGHMRTDGLAVPVSAASTRTRPEAVSDYRAIIDSGSVDAGE